MADQYIPQQESSAFDKQKPVEKQYSVQEKYNQAEKDYLEARIKFDDAKTSYELEKAKSHTILKTTALAREDKLTITDLKYKILIQQSEPESDLGKMFIKYSLALAAKKRMFVEMKCQERAYWDSIKRMT